MFSGVGKTAEELDAAVEAGIGHINVESARSWSARRDRRRGSGDRCQVGIRVNPDVTADTHPYISTGKSGIKFGVPFDQVVPLALAMPARTRCSRSTRSPCTWAASWSTPSRIARGSAACSSWWSGSRRPGSTRCASLDIGGGLGIRYRDEQPSIRLRFAAAVVPLLAPAGSPSYLEPGRFLVGSAGVLLTEVLYRKHSGGKEFVIVDAGMNDLVRPSHYQAYHEIVELEPSGRPGAAGGRRGPGLRDGRLPGAGPELPGPRARGALAVLGAGAYGFVMASNYNTRPRPAEVIVDGGAGGWRGRGRRSRICIGRSG